MRDLYETYCTFKDSVERGGVIADIETIKYKFRMLVDLNGEIIADKSKEDIKDSFLVALGLLGILYVKTGSLKKTEGVEQFITLFENDILSDSGKLEFSVPRGYSSDMVFTEDQGYNEWFGRFKTKHEVPPTKPEDPPTKTERRNLTRRGCYFFRNKFSCIFGTSRSPK